MRGLVTACPISVRGCSPVLQRASARSWPPSVSSGVPHREPAPSPARQLIVFRFDDADSDQVYLSITPRQLPPALDQPGAQWTTGKPRFRARSPRLPRWSVFPWPSGADSVRTGVPVPSRQCHELTAADWTVAADGEPRCQPNSDKSMLLRSGLCGGGCCLSWWSRLVVWFPLW